MWMRWIRVWPMILMMVLLLVLAAPVMAQNLAPDEYGGALLIGDNPNTRPVSAQSWGLLDFEVNGDEWTGFGSLLGLEQGHVGGGIDAGKTDGNLRGGIGYVHDDLWGLYARYATRF